MLESLDGSMIQHDDRKMQESITKQVKSEFIQIEKDLKAEFIAMELVERGLKPEQLIFLPESVFQRSYRKDIVDILPDDAGGEDVKIHFHISREGLYDTLPEGLFHKQSRKKVIQSKEEMIEEIRQHRTEMANARKFFLPFDNEFIHQRLQLEKEERRGALEFLLDQDIGIFFRFSDALTELNDQQLDYVIQLLPVLHELRGDLVASEFYFAKILEEHISITPVQYVSERYSIPDAIPMSDMQLGHTSLLGNDMEEVIPVLKIEIGPLPVTSLEEYLNGGRKHRVFSFLSDLLLPPEYEIVQAMILREDDKNFYLGESQLPSLLGYNACL